MHTVFIGLGSNLSDPRAQVSAAVSAINQIKAVNVRNCSSLYVSKPMGPQDQPDYVNAVVEVTTSLAPLALLDELQALEHNAGRVRKGNRWGARILDLDILLFNQDIIDNERLTVPHYGMKVREFVLLPLIEIAPKLVLPDGDILLELSDNIEHNALEKQGKIAWH